MLKIATGERKTHYQEKMRNLKRKIFSKKDLWRTLQRLEDYHAYQNSYLLFKQHHNIELPADICGCGNCFALIRLKIGDIKRLWDGKIYSLQECSPYKFLETRDEKIYQQYIQKNIDVGNLPKNTTCNVKQFIELEKSILENGYDPKNNVIVVDENNLILDGQHRSCILLYHYGSDYEVIAVQVSRK